MNWKNEILKGYRFLMMHRLRAALSTLGVLFGVVSVVAMLSIGEGAKQETLEQIKQLGMQNIIIRQNLLSDVQQRQATELRSRGLSLEDAGKLGNGVPGLLQVSPVKAIETNLIGAPHDLVPEVLAVTATYKDVKQFDLLEGRFICDKDVGDRKLVCVLGYEVAKGLGKNGGYGNTVRLNNVGYQIVGIIKPTQWSQNKSGMMNARDMNKTIFIPLGTESSISKKTGIMRNALSEIIIKLADTRNIEVAARIVSHILRQTHHGHEDYQVVIPLELMKQASRTQKTFNLVLGSIAGISLLVGGIGIMNIMLATVSERTREIGIRRAIGANKRHILVQFLMEALLLTSGGAILGVIIGVLAAYGISYFAGWKTIVTFWSVFVSLLMAIGVGIGSGIYPAIQASQMNPITALRHD